MKKQYKYFAKFIHNGEEIEFELPAKTIDEAKDIINKALLQGFYFELNLEGDDQKLEGEFYSPFYIEKCILTSKPMNKKATK